MVPERWPRIVSGNTIIETIPSRRYASLISATIVVACTSSQTSGSENGTKGAVLPVGRGMAREANSSEMPKDRTICHEPLGLARHTA